MEQYKPINLNAIFYISKIRKIKTFYLLRYLYYEISISQLRS
jgi:hypothetical protein